MGENGSHNINLSWPCHIPISVITSCVIGGLHCIYSLEITICVVSIKNKKMDTQLKNTDSR